MTRPLPRLLMLDLDDTLYLERDFATSGFRAVDHWMAERYGIADFGACCRRLFEAGRRGDVFDAALAELGLVDRVPVAELVRVYREHRPEITLLPDARRLLERVAGHLSLVLITDGPAAAQQRKIEALDLARRFDRIIVTDLWGHEFWKPHPRAFQEALATFGLPPEQALWIADNPLKDFRAPRALGIPSIRVRRPGGIYADLPTGPEGVDLEVGDLDALDVLAFTDQVPAGS